MTKEKFDLKSFVYDLRDEIEQAQDIERKFEKYLEERGYDPDPDEPPTQDEIEDTYESTISNKIDFLKTKLMYALERVGCPISAKYFLEEMKEHDGKLGKLNFDSSFEFYWSDPLRTLRKYFLALKSELEKSAPDQETMKVELVEKILKSTGNFLFRQKISPTKEKQVKDAIFEVLHISFDAVREFSIPHSAAHFKPDIGVKEIGMAIEYKYCDSEEKLTKSIGGIFEDIHAYSGSKDWTKFIGVIYCNNPYTTQEKIDSTAKSANVPENWKIILCVGQGT